MRSLHREEELFRWAQRGIFDVRRDGSIWRVKRRTKSRWDGRVSFKAIAPRRVDSGRQGQYRTVKMTVDGLHISALAHRLVWRRFRGPIPGQLTVNHKNGNKSDNRLENLELATHQEQARHARDVLARYRRQNGEANTESKLRREEVWEIRLRRDDGEPLLSISQDFGIAQQTVSKIAKRTAWAWLPERVREMPKTAAPAPRQVELFA